VTHRTERNDPWGRLKFDTTKNTHFEESLKQATISKYFENVEILISHLEGVYIHKTGKESFIADSSNKGNVKNWIFILVFRMLIFFLQNCSTPKSVI